jgi:glyoxylase-like metal-dependent hydrolase (beta-lactamase superfamily II)
VGDIRVTYLPDGEAHLTPTGVFPASTEEGWQAHKRWLDDDGWWVASVGGFLVETGDRKILVDLGFGDQSFEAPGFATAQGGRFLESLKQAGVLPEQVDTVVLTHLHSDHTGWISHQGSLSFPNATYMLGNDEEWTFFQEHTDVPFHPGDSVRDLANRFETTTDGQAIAAGVNVRATQGHTPGHQSIVISSGSERAIIMGDILHCPAQITEPEWNTIFDVDVDLARRVREQLLAEMESDGTIACCGHVGEAVFGRVLPGEGKRMWQIAV